MSFQVRAKLVAFLGDMEKYPCHFGHNVGDEVIFDGEKYIGRLCPDVWPMLAPKVFALHAAGPRYIEPLFYYPFFYEPPTIKDDSMKIYDGLGYKNVFETRRETRYHMANLMPPNGFTWPPHPERTVARDISIICPDTRSSALFVLEAFDLSEKGFDTPYFRRQMVILDRVLMRPGIAVNNIISEFSKFEREEIVPYLSPQNLPILIEELELMGYMTIEDGKASVPSKGEARLNKFKSEITAEEREALQI